MLDYVIKMAEANLQNQKQLTNTASPCTQEPIPPGCVESDSNSQDSEVSVYVSSVE